MNGESAILAGLVGAAFEFGGEAEVPALSERLPHHRRRTVAEETSGGQGTRFPSTHVVASLHLVVSVIVETAVTPRCCPRFFFGAV
jgi:hypothetical protein